MSKSFLRIAKIAHHCLNFQFSLFRSFHLLSVLFSQVIMSVVILGVVVVFVYMLEFKSESATLALGLAICDRARENVP